MTAEKNLTCIEGDQLPGYWLAFLDIFFKNLYRHLRNVEIPGVTVIYSFSASASSLK